MIGNLPDEGETRAIRRLAWLSRTIGRVHSKGAKLIVVSDGRVYNDIIGVPDETVTRYGSWIGNLCKQHGLEWVTLETLIGGRSPDEVRTRLSERVRDKETELLAKLGKDTELTRLYVGFTQFLAEDIAAPRMLSKNAFLQLCKDKARQMIVRNEAYSAVLRESFPEALRLSIHPHPHSTEKLGISLLNDGSGAPWHNVVVRMKNGRVRVMRRREAEQHGFGLVIKDGRPWCFEER